MCQSGLTLNDLYDTTCMTHNPFVAFTLSSSFSHRVHKSYSRVSLQEFKQNDSRTSCSSSNYYTNFREKQPKEKGKNKGESVWNLDLKKLRILWKSACRTLSSKTVTCVPGATEERIVDGALTEQRITPRPPSIRSEDYYRAWITAE